MTKIQSKFILFLLSAVFVTGIFCSACGQGGQWYGFLSEYYFRTSATLRLYAEDGAKDEAVRLTREIGRTLKEIEESVSISFASSDVTKFNDAEAGESVELGETAYRVFCEAMRLYRWTDGYYNPAVFHSVAAYGFYADESEPQTLPNGELLSALQQLCEQFGKIRLTEGNGRYYAEKPESGFVLVGETRYELKVDFGGIGKGYATDTVLSIMDESGFSYGYFNFSSSSMAIKKYLPRRKEFALTVAAPRGEGAYLSMNVSDTTLSTSADNGLYYIRDGVRYCQIINPKTGMPVNVTQAGTRADGIITATVLGGTATEGDALTTALMAMGRERAIAFIRDELSDRRVFFVYESGDGSLEVVTNARESEFRVVGTGYRLTVLD